MPQHVETFTNSATMLVLCDTCLTPDSSRHTVSPLPEATSVAPTTQDELAAHHTHSDAFPVVLFDNVTLLYGIWV